MILHAITVNRRKRRNNAEMFDKNEIIFQLDEWKMPVNIGLKRRLESEKLVE